MRSSRGLGFGFEEIGMRVCYFGTYRANYSRNQIMIEGLRRNGVEVVECHQRLWHGIEDRVDVASGGWRRIGFPFRLLRTYWRLLQAYRQVGEYDVMVLGYPGQLDVPLARLLTRLRRKPLVLDVFMSVCLIAEERGLTQQHRFTARLIYEIEKLACGLPDRLILDTAEYVRWFQARYGVDAGRFRLVPTGADDRVFRPVEPLHRDDGRFRLLYYGTFIRNHGLDQVVRAAALLREQTDVVFELIGDGPERASMEALARELGADNVEFAGWVEKSELPRQAAAADICLGAFGRTPQSLMTVQNTIYEGLAMRKCVVTGDSPTVRRALVHGRHACLVPRGEPEALAEAVLVLKGDPDLRRKLAEEGYRLYRQQYTPTALGERLRKYLEDMVPESESSMLGES